MSELNVYHHELRHNEYDEFYLKYEADKVIAEKDAEIAGLKESIKNRRLKRALYKVCDNWSVCEMDYWRKCLEHYEDYFNVRTDEDLTEEKCERMIDNWRKVAHNCRAKAEEYKCTSIGLKRWRSTMRLTNLRTTYSMKSESHK